MTRLSGSQIAPLWPRDLQTAAQRTRRYAAMQKILTPVLIILTLLAVQPAWPQESQNTSARTEPAVTAAEAQQALEVLQNDSKRSDLIQTLQTIGSRNQFFLSTHSPDIISASLDRSVVFVSPPRDEPGGEPSNQAILVSEDDNTHQALRLLGQSIGIVALGRRRPPLEGAWGSPTSRSDPPAENRCRRRTAFDRA